MTLRPLSLPANLRARLSRWFDHRHLPLHLALLAMILAAPALWCGLQVDDFLQHALLRGIPFATEHFGTSMAMFDFADGDPERARSMMDLGFLPWWTFDTVRLRFLRPVTVLTHRLDYRLWPNSVPLMHLHSLVWLGAVVSVATLLYRRFMGIGWAAGLAALLYALDEAHGRPAAWLANRNGVLAAFFGLVVVLLHDRWRKDRNRAAAVAAPLCLLLGLLANEGALAACAYLFAYALALDRGTWRARLLTLLPCGLIVVAWRIVYSALGYGTWGSEYSVDPVRSPLRFLNLLWVRAPVLLLGQWGLPPSDVYTLLTPTGRALMWVGAMLFLAWLFTALVPLLRRDPVARFWMVGSLLSLLPICATFPMDRLLFFVGLGAMGLLAQLLGMTREGLSRPRRALCLLLVGVHVVLAPVLFPTRIAVMAAAFSRMPASLETLPLDEDVADKTVVFASAPNVFFTGYMPVLRALHGLPVPAHACAFAPMSRFPVPIPLTRTDEYTVEVEPESGYPWYLVRDSEHPFAVGDEVRMTGVTVTVLSLTGEGFPRRVAFRFDVPLEDPSLVWLAWRKGSFIPFTPPAVGESVTLENSL